MKTPRFKYILVLILGAIFLASGCSSIDKARSLHQKGETQKALDMAEELLDDGEDEGTRLKAIALLIDIGGDRAGKILFPVLDDEMVSVKNAAIKAVGKIGYAPASEKLLSIGISSKGDTFEAAAVAIRDMGPPAIDLLVKKYSESGSAAKKQQYKSLMLEVGPSVASGIAKNLAGKTYFENRTNFELLIAFKSPDVARWLLKEIGNDEVAENVMEGLVKVGSRSVAPVINELKSLPVNNDNATIRARLITVLGQLKARQATSILEELTRDDSNSVREAADLALKRIRGF